MTMINLTSTDGHRFTAYQSLPAGKPRGSLVVVQEIFGVNHHIRGVCDRFAQAGWRVISPALFDRLHPGVDLGYSEADRTEGRAILAKIPMPQMELDTQAAIDAASAYGNVGVVGYCLGGSLAWFAATRMSGVSAAVAYYGALIPKFPAELPKCPVMMHFGEEDAGIPLTGVEAVREAQKGAPVEIFTYPGAGHGFSCDERASFNAVSHELALGRTMEFLNKNVGAKGG